MVSVPTDKLKAAETALTQIERQFGKGSIMRLGAKEFAPISSISTCSIGVDAALGVGGVPRGRIIEIFGPESSGKTTLSLHIIAEAQRTGGLAAFIDAEHALDAEYAKKLGVDIDNLLVSQPDSGEQALEIAEVLVRSNSIDVIVIDSVAALVPRAELEGEMGDSHVGLQARLMSQALRKLTGIVSKSKTCLIFINQIREKIGVMFGNPETTTGGRALKFYSSVRAEVRRIASIKDGDSPVGKYVLLKNVPFLVTGVMTEKGASPNGSDQDDVIFVPITTGLVRLFGKNYLSSITLKVKDAADIEATQQSVENLLRERHKTEDFSVRNMASFLQAAMETQDTFTLLLGTVAAISLLVGGIGVMNIMLVSVVERTREIGIRMATGARMRDILLQFNIEAAVVCAAGGVLGILIGMAAGMVLRYSGMAVIFSITPAVLAFACASATGLIFGYLPARKAAQLDPVVALASE